MLNAVAGVWPVDSGKIIIDGTDVTKLGEHQRAAYIGRVFQDPMTGTAGQQAHAGGQAILQAQVQALEQFTVALPLGLGDADPQAAALAAPGGQSKVLLDLHSGGGAGHH